MRCLRAGAFTLGMALVFGLGSYNPAAVANQITFIHTGVGSGSLGRTSFAATEFTITAIGDTANRQQVGSDVYFIDHDSAVIDISGVGVLTFVSPTRTFVNQSGELVGFSRGGGGTDLYNGPFDSSFATWDMLSSIGPISGATSLLQWGFEDVITSGGVLRFDNAATQGSFEARVGNAAVPEPSSIVCLGIGIICITAGTGAARRRSARG